jgi:hypothetical protein
LDELPPGCGNPLIELGSVANREAHEKPGDVGRERSLRFLERELPEVANLALDRLSQLDDGSIAADDLAQRVAEVLEGLSEGGAGFRFRRFTPEESGQLLPAVGTLLEHEIGEEGKHLAA